MLYAVEHLISNLIYRCNNAQEFEKVRANMINQEMKLKEANILEEDLK